MKININEIIIKQEIDTVKKTITLTVTYDGVEMCRDELHIDKLPI